MEDPFLLASIGILGMLALIALHIPIGVAMGIAGFIGVGFLLGWAPAITLFGTEASSHIASSELAIIPLFLLMGSFAGAAGLSSDIYRLAYVFVGHRRGSLALATIGGCAGFGAVCGSSVATAATMTKIALPEMLDRKYSHALAAGSIASGGTLGMLIPPSVIMVLYGVLTEQFVIVLFVAAVVPGIMAVTFYFVAIAIQVRINPDSGPAGPKTQLGGTAQDFRPELERDLARHRGQRWHLCRYFHHGRSRRHRRDAVFSVRLGPRQADPRGHVGRADRNRRQHRHDLPDHHRRLDLQLFRHPVGAVGKLR
jgi:TRAP-type mannitol/chloroaromatic compound transport system permease large subunit